MSEENKAKKILLVDDDDFFLWFEREGLERSHFELQEARNGQDALAAIEAFRPDLVLLDLYLPDINGDEILRKVKENPELSSIPIIIVSSEEDPEKRESLIKSGASDFLTKPIVVEDLKEKVNKTVGESVRVHERLPAPPSLKIKYRKLEELIKSNAGDLSEGGIFVKTKKPMEPGGIVKLTLYHVDNSIQPFEVEGVCVRVAGKKGEEDSAAGMGIKFINLTEESRKQVDKIIASEKTTRKLDIMIIEDDKVIAQMLVDALTGAGLKIQHFENGFDGLKNLAILNPALIITDIVMPKLDGLEFSKALRNNSKTKDIPFIFLSSKTDHDTILKAKELGASYFVAKPFEMDILLHRISEILGKELTPGKSEDG